VAPSDRHNGSVLRSYLTRVDRAVDATPTARNRVVDTWRVIALLVVVYGHWLAASVWVRDDGDVLVGNTLEWIPYAGWLTWLIQVMPIFFFVGGYANAKALAAHTSNRRSWLVIRFRRLSTPAVPVIVAWTVLAFALRTWVDADLVYAGVLNATIPLWFLAVYLMLIAIAPITHAAWERLGLISVAALVGASVAVDVAYRLLDIPGIGWANLVFVWGAIHQLGYWWESRERQDAVLSPGRAMAMAGVALAALVAVTTIDWYPVAMITIPGGGPQNVTPPTTAVVLLAIVQAGVILATSRRVSRWAHERRRWRFIVGVSGFIMSIYVWHLTALSLVIAAGIFTFDGVVFATEPGTAAWWIGRPLFYAALTAVTGAFVAVFGRFEHDIEDEVAPHSMIYWVTGMVLTVVALSATAFVYLVDRDAGITWWIPVVTVLAAALMGAYPSSWRRRTPQTASPSAPHR
jgi:surface polysaccharide O-acyltransferase-like enzyme